MLPAFRLARPRSLDEALDAIGDDEVPYCGGTELLLSMRAGLRSPETLVDIKGVPELAGIHRDGDEIVIGALERHMDVALNPEVRRSLPMLARVEQHVGNARVRAQGSVGGNLVFAEPKSDVGPALLAYDARVVITSATDRREATIDELIQGPYYAEVEPNELLVEVRVPVPNASTLAYYTKYQITERPTIGVALVHDRDNGICRLVVGAVGEVSMLWTFESPDEIDPEAIGNEVDPTEDLTGSERYKRHVTGVYVRRAVEALTKMGER